MNKKEIIEKTAEFVKANLEKAEGTHDWWHIFRVWRMAERIAEEEQADQFIVVMASLLHDLADYKLNAGSDEKGLKFVENHLNSFSISVEEIKHILEIIGNLSFRKTFDNKKVLTIEGQVVQDADRLDTLGAMGIARTFAFGGANDRKIYEPGEGSKDYKNSEEYKQNKSSGINHFYEKLLLIKDLMNTETGKKLAEHRHQFLEKYLEEFMAEWEGKT